MGERDHELICAGAAGRVSHPRRQQGDTVNVPLLPRLVKVAQQVGPQAAALPVDADTQCFQGAVGAVEPWLARAQDEAEGTRRRQGVR